MVRLVFWSAVLASCLSRLSTQQNEQGCFYFMISVDNSSTIPTTTDSNLDNKVGCGRYPPNSSVGVEEKEECSSMSGRWELGFCDCALFTYNMSIRRVPCNGTTEVEEPYNDEELSKMLDKMQLQLDLFDTVLQRTIVGLVIKSVDDRHKCLQAYRRWLCLTTATFYTPASTCPSVESGNSTLLRHYPSLSICHDVIKLCPYYVAALYQCRSANNSVSPWGSKCTNDRQTVASSGYPAFDCPRMNDVEKQKNNSVYCKSNGCCIAGGAGATRSVPGLLTVALVNSFLLLQILKPS